VTTDVLCCLKDAVGAVFPIMLLAREWISSLHTRSALGVEKTDRKGALTCINCIAFRKQLNCHLALKRETRHQANDHQKLRIGTRLNETAPSCLWQGLSSLASVNTINTYNEHPNPHHGQDAAALLDRTYVFAAFGGHWPGVAFLILALCGKLGGFSLGPSAVEAQP
jgi:hypothetical protein